MKIFRTLALLLLCLFAAPVFSPAQSQDSAKTVFQYLQRDSGELEATIVADFKRLFRKKYDRKYIDGIFIFKNEKGEVDTMKVEVRTRGNARLKVCNVPPLKVKFSKKELRKRNLAEEPNSIKMVLGCRNSDNYQQYILREYLAYKLSNLLSDYSYRTQLLRMKFEDKKSKREPDAGFAFFIEPDDEMAARNKGKIASNRVVSTRLLNTDETERFAFFQFMIGNTDWYLYNGHNIVLLAVQNGDQVKIIPIPYDFDYSGFVNAPYAVVNEKLPMEEVTERYYQGYCRRPSQTRETVSYYLSKKEAMLTMAREFPYFDKDSKRHCTSYLESFFETIENERLLKQEILNHCDKWLKRVEGKN
jgi:hypothetical protein